MGTYKVAIVFRNDTAGRFTNNANPFFELYLDRNYKYFVFFFYDMIMTQCLYRDLQITNSAFCNIIQR